jgi:DNA-binding NarL/FixJ family response regulator
VPKLAGARPGSVVVCVPQAALRQHLEPVWDSSQCRLVGLEGIGSARVLAAAVTWNPPDEVSALRKVRLELPEVPLMAVMEVISQHSCAQALRAGAVSVVSGRLPAQHLAARLVRLASKDATLPAAAVRMMAQQLRDAEELREALGPKALELLEMVGDGLTVAEIAHRTHSTERTVYRHLRQVMAQLQVDSREAALVRAARLGLLGNCA